MCQASPVSLTAILSGGQLGESWIQQSGPEQVGNVPRYTQMVSGMASAQAKTYLMPEFSIRCGKILAIVSSNIFQSHFPLLQTPITLSDMA